MSCFVMGFLEDLQAEYHLAVLHDNMNLYRLMVHARNVEEERARINSRGAKKGKIFCG